MPLIRISNVFYWIFLSLWFGCLVMTGITAAIAFPALREREVIVPAFESVAHAEHYKIAAGTVMNRVFFANDVIQLIAAVGVTGIIGVQIFSPRVNLPKVPNFIRLGALSVVLLALAYHLFVLAPRMNMNLVKYWELAEQGQDASQYQEAFDRDHPTASRIMGINALGLIVIIASSAYMMIPMSSAEARRGIRGRGPQLEEPELLHRHKV